MQDTGKMDAERVRARQERRRSGAAGKHADRRTKRKRTRNAQKRAALADYR